MIVQSAGGAAIGSAPLMPSEFGAEPFLRMCNLSVNYGPVRALSDVDLAVRPGSIHAIIGENGAGKSTLLKAMSGIQKPSEGYIEIGGIRTEFANAQQALKAGISCVFQEMSLIPDLSIADNILLLDPPRRFGLIDRAAQRRIVRELLERVGAADLNPDKMIRDLPLSKRQLVEIAKGLASDPKLLILDESTSALTNSDTEHVLSMVKSLRDEGIAILYVSHRMGEIRELADECSVFRDGRKIKSFKADTHTDGEIVEMMLGRSIEASFPPLSTVSSNAMAVVEVEKLAWDDVLTDVTVSVRKGEIVGIGGLDGQGQHEFLMALFGVLKGLEGTIRLNGSEVQPQSPSARIRRRPNMAYVPEDRATHGLVQQMSVGDNILLVDKDSYLGDFWRHPTLEKNRLDSAIKQLKIKVASPKQPAFSLSGGNQQKVVLAKWLADVPDVLLLDDPTRGIDVGTKQEIFELLQDLASKGCAVLLYSSDYQELCNCCHRVLVFYEGKISHELQGGMLTENNLVNAAFNLELQIPDGPRAH